MLVVLLLAAATYQEPSLKESMERGKEIYSDFCVTCHLDNGEGVPFTFPPLANSDYLLEKREASIKALKFGLQGEITVNNMTYNSAMAPMGLDDEEIADVLNFIMNSWENKQDSMVTVDEVSAITK
ncbi:c-type cytochrome [Maribacter sp. CXY002]|uniref:c-type cytochrome n=1 Tax=Maribacter luteocoastalis TaxID=3407671 RepID=UPI003B672B6F